MTNNNFIVEIVYDDIFLTEYEYVKRDLKELSQRDIIYFCNYFAQPIGNKIKRVIEKKSGLTLWETTFRDEILPNSMLDWIRNLRRINNRLAGIHVRYAEYEEVIFDPASGKNRVKIEIALLQLAIWDQFGEKILFSRQIPYKF